MASHRLRLWLGALALAFALAASGAHAADPVDFPGSSWSGGGLISAKVGGKISGSVTFDLDFGPQADPALAADEFLLVLDDGMETFEVSGNYAIDSKGGVALTLDASALETGLADLIYHVCVDVLELGAECDFLLTLDVVIDLAKQKIKLKAKAKDGVEVLAAAGKLPFAMLAGAEQVVKVTIGFKAVAQRD
jgi:hypothetical protein